MAHSRSRILLFQHRCDALVALLRVSSFQKLMDMRWSHDERKEMSSFSEMVSEMAFLPSDGASDLPLEI
ncbi:hypothetical protein F2Q70_00031851 [Brassica cretica]|uniref:Uncharacterized protein n=1 Tax=Brassica cretica TaxID=69181 RepID=A0A8S9G754_BRACR|nr:hypothetical protein F2Q70_00031851 [Brassica cretica]KAF2541740.1 hypothetical protein F2Q68_00031854 [Brassica cretica]